MKLEFFLTDIRRKLKYHQNPSSGGRVVPCGPTVGHDEANNRFAQFCERA
jgi:hypothetical protein